MMNEAGETAPRQLTSWRQVLGNVLALLSGTTLARVVAAIASVLIARAIGPEAYGQYSATLALVGLTTILFSLGLDSWLLYQGGKDRENLTLRYSSALTVKVLLGIVWLAGFWIVAPYLDQSSFPWILIIPGALALWFEEISKLGWSAFTVRLRNDITLVLMIVAQGAFLGMVLWLVSQQVAEPASYMRSKLLAASLGAVATGILAVRRIGLRAGWSTVRSTLRGTLPFAASVAFTTIYGRADLAIVASQLGETAAGSYAPALMLTNALFLMPAAVYGVALPILSRGNEDKSRVWMRRASIRLALAMTLMGIVLGSGLYLLAGPMVHLLYGQEYQASGAILAILSGVLALRCSSTAFATALVAIGWQTRRVGVQGVAAMLNVTLNLLIVRQFGLTGVARVYVVTEAVLLLGYLVLFVLWMRRKPVQQ